MALILSQKSDVRRHLRYPLGGLFKFSTTGGTLADGTASYRYFQPFAFLEWRLNNMAPDEEARLVGNAYASLVVVGPPAQVGDSYTITFSGGALTSPVTLTIDVTSNDLVPSSPLALAYPGSNNGLIIVNKFAQYVNMNTTLQAARIYAVAPFGTGNYSYSVVPVPEVAFISVNAFTISVTSNSSLPAVMTSSGELLNPSMTSDQGTLISGYIPMLNYLESAYATASRDLSTYKADVWTARPSELPDRYSLYSTWQNRLAEFLDVPINPNRRTSMRNTRATRYY